jgi:hypothetical protein
MRLPPGRLEQQRALTGVSVENAVADEMDDLIGI